MDRNFCPKNRKKPIAFKPVTLSLKCLLFAIRKTSKYPNISTSYENRALNVMQIGNGSKKIVLHGGTHAREWITPITMINTARLLVEGFRAGGAEKKYLDDVTWHIVININPDGYNYTWESQRMWRKTRSPTPLQNCVGTDPNRNWDCQWATVGSSNNPCSDTYHGTDPFSEIEMESAAEYIESLGFVEVRIRPRF